MENRIKIHDLGVPRFLEPPIYNIYIKVALLFVMVSNPHETRLTTFVNLTRLVPYIFRLLKTQNGVIRRLNSCLSPCSPLRECPLLPIKLDGLVGKFRWFQGNLYFKHEDLKSTKEVVILKKYIEVFEGCLFQSLGMKSLNFNI